MKRLYYIISKIPAALKCYVPVTLKLVQSRKQMSEDFEILSQWWVFAHLWTKSFNIYITSKPKLYSPQKVNTQTFPQQKQTNYTGRKLRSYTGRRNTHIDKAQYKISQIYFEIFYKTVIQNNMAFKC